MACAFPQAIILAIIFFFWFFFSFFFWFFGFFWIFLVFLALGIRGHFGPPVYGTICSRCFFAPTILPFSSWSVHALPFSSFSSFSRPFAPFNPQSGSLAVHRAANLPTWSVSPDRHAVPPSVSVRHLSAPATPCRWHRPEKERKFKIILVNFFWMKNFRKVRKNKIDEKF